MTIWLTSFKGRSREAFETGMEADPALKSEVATQRLIAKAFKGTSNWIRKLMLNNVPVVEALGAMGRLGFGKDGGYG